MFNGGSVILDYRISIAEQGQAFSILDTTVDPNYTVSGLTSGTTYEFKVESRNEYDYSEFSDTLTLLAAYIPEIPNLVTTTILGD